MSDAQFAYDCLVAADFEVITYSGRGMFGQECIAVVTDRPLDVIPRAFSALAEGQEDFVEDDATAEEVAVFVGKHNEFAEEVERLAALLLDAKMDNMGKDSVIYWPHLSAADVESEPTRASDDEEDAA